MRIVGGQFRGRPLATPRDHAIRPTTDRAREAVFNVLAHRFADKLEGARVLDLFAGTGALGLEALSRGAAFALFVDDRAEARALLRANVEALGAGGASKIYRRDATRLGSPTPLDPFTLVFADPPYGHGLAERALISAKTGGWLVSQALAVVEEAADAPFVAPDDFVELERRTAGDTMLIFLRLDEDPRLRVEVVRRGPGQPPDKETAGV